MPSAAAPRYGMPGPPPTGIAMPPLLLNQTQPGLPSFLPTSQPAPPPVNGPAPPFSMPPMGGQAAPFAAPSAASSQANGFLAAAPPAAAPGGVNSNIILLVQTLASQGIPIEQITAIVAQMTSNNAASALAAPPTVPTALAGAPQFLPPGQNGGVHGYPAPPPAAVGSAWNAPRPDESRDTGVYPGARNAVGGRGRSRSRSPPRHWDQRGSPRGRDSANYGEYGRRPSPPGRSRGEERDDRGRAGRGGPSDYRQRSPPGRRNSSPHRDMPVQQLEKWVQHDPSIPNGHIRVLSRTLFVGGVTGSEAELREIFSRFGEVQTCIVNKDKRHAFIKMYLRKDAVSAKEGMEKLRTADNALRTRWGVGFGPRDCSDYQTGVSVIPIHKLTDADRKWMLTAQYGGSGGKPIVSGMVVEEPDIEIGAGVSSKAISRRMQTDRGGAHGPRSTRRGDGEDGHQHGGGGGGGGGGRNRGGRGGQNRRDADRNNDNPNNIPVPADFGFGLTTGVNGMPIFPAGFSFPAPPGQNGP